MTGLPGLTSRSGSHPLHCTSDLLALFDTDSAGSKPESVMVTCWAVATSTQSGVLLPVRAISRFVNNSRCGNDKSAMPMRTRQERQRPFRIDASMPSPLTYCGVHGFDLRANEIASRRV
jgi:hypothetical protein